MQNQQLDLASVSQYSNLKLIAKKLVEGFITGLHKSPFHGFSVEFAEHKLYNFGESTKNIDWKVYAKTDKLFTKQYEEETNLRCSILVDTSASMYYPKPECTKIKFSLFATAALGMLMINQRDAVGLITFAENFQQTQQKSTKNHFNEILKILQQQLDKLDNVKHTSKISENIHTIAQKLHKRSLVILFTDLFDQHQNLNELFEAFQHLKHNKHEILLFHITDWDTEKMFNFKDIPYKFIDLESKETISVTPSFIKESYQKKMNDFYNEVKINCGKLKIDFIEVNPNGAFDNILLSYLIKRQRMR